MKGSDGIYIRTPQSADEAEFLEGVRRSAALHYPWVEPPSTRAHYQNYMRRIASGRTCGFLACLSDTDAIAGVINLNDVIAGRFLSANLGYYAFVPHQGRGRMLAALRLVIEEAFEGLGMHRLEANIQPGNSASLQLVQRCGSAARGFRRVFFI